MTEKKVLEALSTVQEPDLKKDLVTLGMIKDIEISDNTISFTVILTTPACPLKEIIKKACIDAIHTHINEDIKVNVNLIAEVTTSRSNKDVLSKVKNIIAVASGKGGVGKSTVTANLAVALSKAGAKVGIIDADIFGPSIPVMFDCELSKPAVYQEDGKSFIIPVLQYDIKIMSIGFLAPPDSAIVWRGPMASSALKQFISDTDWGELDYLFIDLPPGTSDIHLTLVQSVPVTGAVIVTTPQKVALADAQKGLAMFLQPQINVPVLGIVENMAYFTPAELPNNKYYIFGENGGKELSEKFNVPLIGQIPLIQKIRENGDMGTPTVMGNDLTAQYFKELAENLAQQVAIRNSTLALTQKVELN